jgi:hypothetical protein
MFRRLMILSSIAVALAGTAALAQDVRGNRAVRRGAARQFRDRAANRNAFSDRRLERLTVTTETQSHRENPQLAYLVRAFSVTLCLCGYVFVAQTIT